jgi:tetratricopeptide (TPR) repeat protein
LKLRPFIPALIIAAGIWAYHNSFHGVFVLDDSPHIVDNPGVRQLARPWQIIRHSSRPVVALSLAVNFALGRLDPWGYHAVNLGIHILAALTLYGVARRTLVSEPLRFRFGEAGPLLAGAISLIWLVHPLQTESVTYIIQRAESLMGLFYLLTLYCVIRSQSSARRKLWGIGAVASCVLGMASKPVMVTAPVVILLYDRAFLGNSWRELMRRRGWLYAGLAATWLLLPLMLANAPSEWETSAGFEYKGVSPLRYALSQPGAVLQYLRLTFRPNRLCLDYGWPHGSSDLRETSEALKGPIVVAALLAATVWAWERRPAMGFLGAWFFLILAPTSSFVPVADSIVEHRMYLPLAAVVAAVVLGAFEIGKRLLNKKGAVVVGCAAGGVVVIVLSSLTIRRNRDYSSAVTIWQDNVEKRPNNPRAQFMLGSVLFHAGKLQEAVDHDEEALRINPDYAEANNNLGGALMKQDRLEEAIAHFQQALRTRPDYADAHYNLGNALGQLGRLQEAVGHYEQALRIRPGFAEAHNNLAKTLIQMGRPAEAIEHWKQALGINPDFAEAQYNLGLALMGEGRLQEAIGHYEKALRIKPDDVQAQCNLGNALVQTGKPQEAIERYEQALRIDPDYAEAHYNLGVALKQAGRVQEAIQHYEQALRIKPDFVEAQNALARARASQ